MHDWHSRQGHEVCLRRSPSGISSRQMAHVFQAGGGGGGGGVASASASGAALSTSAAVAGVRSGAGAGT